MSQNLNIRSPCLQLALTLPRSGSGIVESETENPIPRSGSGIVE
jgi:hypothetical protein